MINTISSTVMNLLLTVLLNKTRFTTSKTCFLAFSIDFQTRNLVYVKVTNSGMLLQRRNILEATFCTVMNLLLTDLRNKTSFTASKTLIIHDLKKLHNPGDDQVPLIGTILFLEIRDLYSLSWSNKLATNYATSPVKKCFVVQKLVLTLKVALPGCLGNG